MAFGSALGGALGGGAGGNVVGGAVVRLLLDAAQFEAGLRSGQTRLAQVGRGMSSVGGALTRGVTLPIIGAAAASVKLAMDFEQSFTRIKANSNASAEVIAKWRGEVLKLSGATGKAPKELADALYFLASAGLKPAQVMETLQMSAKASAAGFGEVSDVAKLTAQVLNAYSKSGMTAAQATDILAAAVREGTAEPVEFAEAMGRILPIASRAGVGFDEVAASLAGLSNIGLDVNEGVTSMRGLLAAIVAPTKAAKDALSEMGITSDELRGVLADDGVLGALKLLEGATGGNIDSLKAIIPNIRALTGELSLTGESADSVAGIFDRVAGAKGSLDKAFGATQDDPTFQFQQAMAELKVAAIEVGTTLLPIAKDIANVLKGWANGFNKLSPAMKQNIVQWGLMAAALGPFLKISGGLLGPVSRLVGLMGKLGGAGTGVGTVGDGAAKAATGFARLGSVLKGAALLAPLAGYAILAGSSARQTAELNKELGDLTGLLLKSPSGTSEALERVADARKRLQDQLDKVDAGKSGFGENVDVTTRESFDWLPFVTSNSELAADAQEKYAAAVREANRVVRGQRKELGFLPGAMSEVRSKTIETFIASGNYVVALKLLGEWEAKARKQMIRRGEAAASSDEAMMNSADRAAEKIAKARERQAARTKRASRIEERSMNAIELSVYRLSGAISGIPPKAQTRFEMPGLQEAVAQSRALNEVLNTVENRQVQVTFRSNANEINEQIAGWSG